MDVSDFKICLFCKLSYVFEPDFVQKTGSRDFRCLFDLKDMFKLLLKTLWDLKFL